ncbi:addiction module antidote protein [Massilia sp. S19_KUP03_FR1]|uniref:addiction module antidote protein n=1 Tax=Massilia sp. S19_KUP03_FR1 TaxID=3025503 RepID=UPI002FCDD9E0
MNTTDTACRLDSLDGLDDFDVAHSLTSDAAIAACINDVISSGEQALRNVIRVRGVTTIAGIAGLTREGTYKALRPSSKPRFETLAALLDALGMEIRLVPKSAAPGETEVVAA